MHLDLLVPPRLFHYQIRLGRRLLTKLMKKVLLDSLTEGLAESVVGAEGAPRAFILKLGYFGLIL